MTEIKIVVVNGKEKSIEVKDGLVLVICGTGPDAGAFWRKFEECGNAELAAAKEVSAEDFTNKPWGDSLDSTETAENNKVENNTNPPAYKIDNSYFDKAVDFLIERSGEDFLTIVKYAKSHKNKFPKLIKELSNIVNADDAYCSALIKLARPLGETVEKRAFEIFETAVTNDELSREYFSKFWRALQIINNFC